VSDETGRLAWIGTKAFQTEDLMQVTNFSVQRHLVCPPVLLLSRHDKEAINRWNSWTYCNW